MLVFGAAVAFMLHSRSQRGGRPLAEAPALGYLPGDTNTILAWNPAAAEPSKEAREFLERIGFVDGGDLDPDKYLGIKRDQIEDVVIGVKIDLRIPIPDFRIIVRTKSAYDAEAVRAELGRTGSKPIGTKTVDTLSPPGLPIQMVMWCATARTLIICHRPEDMEKIPDVPHENCDQLPAPMVDLLKYRSDRDSFLWLVAHNEDWSKTILTLLNLPTEQRKTLFKTQTIGLALRRIAERLRRAADRRGCRKPSIRPRPGWRWTWWSKHDRTKMLWICGAFLKAGSRNPNSTFAIAI